ncbi:hypothetical protein [Geobacter sp.]|uniref:hypothetical protein n=1 Tax=Geobacter sp. TaxID=46610 RepID=UPI001AC91897|nr:hypothetical protein [Geobacter sp.]CAG0942427.1 hypothetical protein BROC_01862 [Candidatus Brocadiaceae bacterium]
MQTGNYYKAVGNVHMSVIANIDILGYKSFVEKPNSLEETKLYLDLLKNAVNKSFEFIRDKTPDFIEYRGWEIKAYTDNISICFPVIEGNINGYSSSVCALNAMLYMLGRFQIELIKEGSFFVRGAIAIDEVYSDEIIVYGKGLLKAHEAEENLAIFPRIIMAESAKMLVDGHIQQVKDTEIEYYLPEILGDSDGQYFVDYLKILNNDDELSENDFLQIHRDTILQKIAEYSGIPPVLRKFLWVVSYHNYHCKRKGLDGLIIDSAPYDFRELMG